MSKRSASNGGGRRIRTSGNIAATLVFKTNALNHSAIPPWEPRHSTKLRPTYQRGWAKVSPQTVFAPAFFNSPAADFKLAPEVQTSSKRK